MGRQILFTADPSFTLPDWEIALIDQPDDDRRVMASAQVLLRVSAPLVLGGHGVMGRLLPRLGFARRAARRSVERYFLVDCDLPPIEGDWPDAPVEYLATSDQFATQAKVAADRGWTSSSAQS